MEFGNLILTNPHEKLLQILDPAPIFEESKKSISIAEPKQVAWRILKKEHILQEIEVFLY